MEEKVSFALTDYIHNECNEVQDIRAGTEVALSQAQYFQNEFNEEDKY